MVMEKTQYKLNWRNIITQIVYWIVFGLITWVFLTEPPFGEYDVPLWGRIIITALMAFVFFVLMWLDYPIAIASTEDNGNTKP